MVYLIAVWCDLGDSGVMSNQILMVYLIAVLCDLGDSDVMGNQN